MKILRQQQPEMRRRFNLIPSRFNGFFFYFDGLKPATRMDLIAPIAPEHPAQN
jgi:hypothetical protein